MLPEQNPKNYKWGFFYHNPNDDRLFLPKPNPMMGIQINFGHPRAWIWALGIIAFFGFIIYMIGRKT